MSEPAPVPEPAAADAPRDDAPRDDAPRDDAPGTEAPGGDAPGDDRGPGLPPPTAVESLVGALLEAGPEVAEHVVRAAQELLLAVQVIVDAADRAVQEQQRLQADAAAADESSGPDAHADPDPDADAPVDADDEPGAAGGRASVRHLDLAE
ncbi:MAG TPA: hypothetical protein VFW06_06605 [Acidimicrobiia bacterium]|nr:hypothetical protein [Acidimicrobiia bacterium]